MAEQHPVVVASLTSPASHILSLPPTLWDSPIPKKTFSVDARLACKKRSSPRSRRKPKLGLHPYPAKKKQTPVSAAGHAAQRARTNGGFDFFMEKSGAALPQIQEGSPTGQSHGAGLQQQQRKGELTPGSRPPTASSGARSSLGSTLNATLPPKPWSSGAGSNTLGSDGTVQTIAQYYRVLRNLVSALDSAENRKSPPLPLSAEYLMDNIARNQADLVQVIRSSEDKGRSRDPNVGRVALQMVHKVNGLHHEIRRWKWALAEARKNKLLSQLRKEEQVLEGVHVDLKTREVQLVAFRKHLYEQLKLHSKVRVKWRTAEQSARKNFNTLGSSFGFVTGRQKQHAITSFFAHTPENHETQAENNDDNPAEDPQIDPTRVTSPDVLHRTKQCQLPRRPASEMLQTIKAMKVTVTQSQRANREITALLAFEKRKKQKIIAHISELMASLALQRRLGHQDDSSSQHFQEPMSAWCGPKATDFVKYRLTNSSSQDSAVSTGLEFLKQAAASSGNFPYLFLADLSAQKQTECVNFMSREFSKFVWRTRGQERIFQSLQEIRCFHNVDKAVAYIVDVVCCVLGCERASFWIIDSERGIAWTKSAVGGKEMCIPINTGFVGAAVTTNSVINVKDAYADPRFNPAGDKASGFRTTSILAVPMSKAQFATIQDVASKTKARNKLHPVIGAPRPRGAPETQQSEVLAVVQVVNKISDSHPYFDDADVFMLTALGYSMTEVVLTCEQEELDFQTNFRKNIVLSYTWEMCLKCHYKSDLIRIINTYLGKLFKGQKATLSLVHNDHIMLLQLNEDGASLMQKQVPKDIGLVGACIESRSRIHVRDLSLDKRYDAKVDLYVKSADMSHISLHCWPLKRSGLLSAVIQWVCTQRSRVDFGDDGLFNENNPRHIDLLSKLMGSVQGVVESWFPTMDRLEVKARHRASDVAVGFVTSLSRDNVVGQSGEDGKG
eukprot:GEMP01008306.1.p1 GENE.GEMP01008306.1~~GEMP01008306.1.p1  ORF type:complete len:954 (+),score=224.89 GEMP01008306.1:100-2961(+)